MSESLRMWVEIVFNISYLVLVWAIVFVMAQRLSQGRVTPANHPMATRVMQAFALLALGDTGHVGFRVWAYALGGLESKINVLGVTIPLVGVGAFATAVTVTFFYVLMLDGWRMRFNKKFGWFEYGLLGAAAIRLVMMLLPANEWGSVTPPEPFGIYRNIPLIIQGLGLMYLIWRDARAAQDRTFLWIAASIMVSYACYTPVIFFVNQVPLLGMLMIPKTLAYLAIAILAYRGLYQPEPARQVATA